MSFMRTIWAMGKDFSRCWRGAQCGTLSVVEACLVALRFLPPSLHVAQRFSLIILYSCTNCSPYLLLSVGRGPIQTAWAIPFSYVRSCDWHLQFGIIERKFVSACCPKINPTLLFAEHTFIQYQPEDVKCATNRSKEPRIYMPTSVHFMKSREN